MTMTDTNPAWLTGQVASDLWVASAAVSARCADYLQARGLDEETARHVGDTYALLGLRMAPKVESPIEARFLLACQYHRLATAYQIVLPQVQVGPYRVDFLIKMLGDPDGVGVIVECDGHDFHERTKEQAERDRKRDRDLGSQGYRVLRFTGRELWRDPHSCADEAMAAYHWRHTIDGVVPTLGSAVAR
jgi:very-short-patch-repair endonuclease